MHTLLVGIEHLFTGVQIRPVLATQTLTFSYESPSIVKVTCDVKIEAYWPVTQSFMQSTESPDTPHEKYSMGEAEWYAKKIAPLLVDAENRSRFDMQTYTRRAAFTDGKGNVSRYAPGEPSPFPHAVVKSMRRKFGAEADKWLSELRWDKDHWYFIKDRMYHGVEPDGTIHT